MIGVVVLVAIVAAPVLTYWLSYNRLVNARQEVADAWAAIDVELDRRHVLVPRLVEAVSGAAAHEQDLVVELSRRNAAAVAARSTPESATTWEPPLTRAVADVIALRERYPALNAQVNFLELQSQLAVTEDRIAASRRFYNTRVARLNTRVAAFPSAFVARRHAVQPAQHFDAEAD